MKGLTLNIDGTTSADEKKLTVLLSLNNSKDRELIKDFLPDVQYLDIQADDQQLVERNIDLCIVDEHTFAAYKEMFQKRKKQIAPVFLPVLLLATNEEQVMGNSVMVEFVDDVVYIPASKKLMQSRINLLLKQREYSLKLDEKNHELEQKNKELLEEKRKYQLLADNSTDMISRHAPDGTYLYASQVCEDLTGYTQEELVGQNAFDNMHPEDSKRLRDIVGNFKINQIERWEFRKETKGGNYKWVESVMKPIADKETGEITEIQASTRDITKRKRYEQELEEEKEFTDTAIESLPELFFVVDEDQNFVRWNKRIEEQLGYNSNEIEQMHPLAFYSEEDHGFIAAKIREAFQTGSAEAEVQMQTKDGDLIPYFVTAQNFEKNDKNYIVGSCVNLIDRKEAQFEIEQNQKLLDAIINQTNSIIYVKDDKNQYRLVNDSFLELFGYDRDDVIGKTPLEVHGQEIGHNVKEVDQRILEEHQVLEVEEEIPVDGKIRYYRTIKYPLMGVPGYENFICGIATDISDEKQVLDQLKERVKEQRCLYNISSLPEQNLGINEMLKKAANFLPEGWYHPEDTEVAITFDGETYQTKDFTRTEYMLFAESNRIPDKPLQIQVAYIDEDVSNYPFLEEERKLVGNIADTLSSQIDRLLAQQKLKDSEQRWESLVSNDPDLIQISNTDGVIKFINPSGAKMYGVDDPEDIVGKNFFDLLSIGEPDLEIIKTRMKKALEGESIPPKTYKIGTLDGTERYVEIQSVLITLENGEKGLQQVAQDITNRKRYEEELKQSVEEKEVLLQEVHHRVKNNLAVVSGMLQLQGFQSKNKEIRKVLSNSEKRIKTMALIHEKLYQSESLSQIDFGDYVDALLKNISKLATNEVAVNLRYDSFSLNVNQAVPCALIINEIVSNAFEHAFDSDANDGTVDITISIADNTISVEIADNGRGLPGDFDDRKSESLGFTIVETLVKQLNAEVNVNSENGFAFSFSFQKQTIKGSTTTFT